MSALPSCGEGITLGVFVGFAIRAGGCGSSIGPQFGHFVAKGSARCPHFGHFIMLPPLRNGRDGCRNREDNRVYPAFHLERKNRNLLLLIILIVKPFRCHQRTQQPGWCVVTVYTFHLASHIPAICSEDCRSRVETSHALYEDHWQTIRKYLRISLTCGEFAERSLRYALYSSHVKSEPPQSGDFQGSRSTPVGRLRTVDGALQGV